MQIDEQLAKKKLEDVMDRLLIHHGWESPRRAVGLLIRNIDLSDCVDAAACGDAAAREAAICECEKYLHVVSYSACGLRKKDKDAGIDKDVELAASKKEIARLRQSFKAYAFHTSNCAIQHSRAPCDCGFDQVNKQATKEE